MSKRYGLVSRSTISKIGGVIGAPVSKYATTRAEARTWKRNNSFKHAIVDFNTLQVVR